MAKEKLHNLNRGLKTGEFSGTQQKTHPLFSCVNWSVFQWRVESKGEMEKWSKGEMEITMEKYCSSAGSGREDISFQLSQWPCLKFPVSLKSSILQWCLCSYDWSVLCLFKKNQYHFSLIDNQTSSNNHVLKNPFLSKIKVHGSKHDYYWNMIRNYGSVNTLLFK